MTIARGYVDMAVAETTEPEIAEHLEVVSRQLDRTETLSSRLLSLSALDSDPEAHVDMLDLAAVCRRLAKEWTAAENREWVLEVCSPVWILADVSGIEAAIDAMIENAIHFTAPGMAIRVTCRKIDGFALVEVADSGPGIDEADQPFVFERFWHRTPPDGVVGSGLGLSMVAAVAQAHGGYATAGTAQEGGASISMTFARPTASEDAAPSPASSCHDIELDASSVSTVTETSTSPVH
jgi:signal transduction histidine kinase